MSKLSVNVLHHKCYCFTLGIPWYLLQHLPSPLCGLLRCGRRSSLSPGAFVHLSFGPGEPSYGRSGTLCRKGSSGSDKIDGERTLPLTPSQLFSVTERIRILRQQLLLRQRPQAHLGRMNGWPLRRVSPACIPF